MDQSLITWMLNGGERFESREDRRQRTHRIALREAAVATPQRPAFGGLFARWTERPSTAASVGLVGDCCAA